MVRIFSLFPGQQRIKVVICLKAVQQTIPIGIRIIAAGAKSGFLVICQTIAIGVDIGIEIDDIVLFFRRQTEQGATSQTMQRIGAGSSN